MSRIALPGIGGRPIEGSEDEPPIACVLAGRKRAGSWCVAMAEEEVVVVACSRDSKRIAPPKLFDVRGLKQE